MSNLTSTKYKPQYIDELTTIYILYISTENKNTEYIKNVLTYMNINYNLITTIKCTTKILYITFNSSFTRDIFLNYIHTFKDSKYSKLFAHIPTSTEQFKLGNILFHATKVTLIEN